MPKKTLEDLENLQVHFLKCLFAVGSGCPLPSLLWESGSLLMEFRILKKKLLFLHHLRNLPGDSLAKEVLEIQTKFGLPGIEQECSEFLAHFGIHDLSLYSKAQFKKVVNTKINELNKSKLIQIVKTKNYKKIDHELMSDANFSLQPYLKSLNVAEARLHFKIQCKMVPTIKMNFQSDAKFTSELWACGSCLSDLRDSQEHVLVCSSYEVYRKDKNLSDEKDLVDYYKSVLIHRSKET